ncbi:MAG TPA: GNAT family N-acetyltransferase [Candidatus Paceibacterota bacterium]|nr:GNAT family N-acetyltransferase [Candidatus Paceibacterota bacterium]
MTIKKLTAATPEALADINAINSQLHDDGRKGTLAELEAIVDNKNCILLVAKDGDKIVGMASLYIMPKLGKRSAYVEDVVVDGAYRGQGLGEKLMRDIIDTARTEKVNTLYLTSRPDRVAARALYNKIGFTVKDTAVFKMDL